MSESAKNITEKILAGLLVGAVILTILGAVLQVRALMQVSIVCLMIVTAVYAVLQIIEYLQPIDDPQKNKQLLWIMVIAVAIALVVLAFGILYLCGKLF